MVSGAQTSLHAKQEATYLAATTVSTGVLGGHGLKITSQERNNNLQAVWGLGSRTQTVIIEKQFTGTLGIEFLMSNSWFLHPIMGKSAHGGIEGAYTHIYTEEDTLPSYKFQNSLNIDSTSTSDIKIDLLGVVNTSASIKTAVGEAVSVTMDFIYANELLTTPSTYIGQTAETFQPYSFAHGVLELPNGTTVANCQSVDISITQNSDMIFGLGSRSGTAHVDKNRAYAIKTSAYFTTPAAFLQLFYNGSTGTAPGAVVESATLNLTFTNGTQSVEFAFTGLKIDTESLPQSIDAAVMEDISLQARTLTVTATDTITGFPAVLSA